MRWIDAQRRLAQVVDREPVRNWTNISLVRHAVGECLSPHAGDLPVEVPVAVATDGAFPDPAFRAPVDLRLKPLSFVLWFRSSHPTKFTEFIGHQLLAHIGAVQV